MKNLLTVKSLVTLTLTLVFSYLSIIGKVSGEQFLTIFTTVVAFYFGVQKAKGDYEKDAEDKNENDT